MASNTETGGPACYIVTVSGGTCVEKTATGVFDKTCFKSNDAQHWTAEYGKTDDQVVFQNSSNGEYLCAKSGAAYGQVTTSTEKQWWTLEQAPSPGAWW